MVKGGKLETGSWWDRPMVKGGKLGMGGGGIGLW